MDILPNVHPCTAEVAKLADAHVSGACSRKGVRVRPPPSAPQASGCSPGAFLLAVPKMKKAVPDIGSVQPFFIEISYLFSSLLKAASYGLRVASLILQNQIMVTFSNHILKFPQMENLISHQKTSS
jgi:hypothetical protein